MRGCIHCTTTPIITPSLTVRRRLMTPLQKGRLVIDGDRTAGTRDRGIGGSFHLITVIT